MTVFVGHKSALKYWRTDGFIEPSLSQALPREGTLPSRNDLEKARAICGISEPSCLHLYFSSSDSRRRYVGCASHVQGNLRPRRSFCQLSKRIYIASPEACILQIAPDFSVAELSFLISELCGWYSFDSWSGLMVPSAPRMSLVSLESYLRGSKGAHGVKKALRSVRYSFNGSASPMETNLALLLSLPTAYGGYGIPKPILNAAVRDGKLSLDPPRKGDSFFVGELRCDLSWPTKRFALEYDSATHHEGPTNIDSDSKRRTKLESSAINVLSVTKGQVYSAARFDELARVVAKKVGYRLEATRTDWPMLRSALRAELLFGETGYQGAETSKTTSRSE